MDKQKIWHLPAKSLWLLLNIIRAQLTLLKNIKYSRLEFFQGKNLKQNKKQNTNIADLDGNEIT